MKRLKAWKEKHPDIYEFILFNILSNCATITNFAVMWICTGFVFKSFREIPFRAFLFDYTTKESLMLCGFLSFLTATAAAQTVNFFVQKNLVFHSDAAFGKAAWKYAVLAVVLVLVSTALPAYSQRWLAGLGISESIVPTLANVLNILVQVVISYPTMKFWVMPGKKESPEENMKKKTTEKREGGNL